MAIISAKELYQLVVTKAGSARRRELRKLTTKAISDHDQGILIRTAMASPIVGTDTNKHNIRAVFSGVRDQLDWEMLTLLVFHYGVKDSNGTATAGITHPIDCIVDALTAPDIHGIAKADSKSGWWFGVPRMFDAFGRKQMMDELRAEAQQEDEQAINFDPMTDPMPAPVITGVDPAAPQQYRGQEATTVIIDDPVTDNPTEAGDAPNMAAPTTNAAVDLISKHAGVGLGPMVEASDVLTWRIYHGTDDDIAAAALPTGAVTLEGAADVTKAWMEAAFNEQFYKPTSAVIQARKITGQGVPDLESTTWFDDNDLSMLGATIVDDVVAANTAAPAPVADPNANPIKTIDPHLKTALDGLLSSATDGKETDISVVFQRQRDDRRELDNLKEALGDANKATKKAEANAATAIMNAQAAASIPKEVKGDGTIPSGKVVMKSAKEIFKINGKRNPKLDFEVPTFEWDGPHPLVDPIDPDYIFDTVSLVPCLWALNTNRPCWTVGHTGTGKSTLWMQISARLGWPLVRVNFDSEISRMDMIGRDVLKEVNGATVSTFVDGILPQAMQMPCIFLADEMDFVRPDIAYVFQRALEGNGLLLNEDGGRLITPDPMFRVAATANTKGQGDEYGSYRGAQQQSMALLDRFTAWVTVDYLPKEREWELVKAKAPTLKDELIEQIVALAGEVRRTFANGEISQTISPRTLVGLAHNFQFLTGITKSHKTALKEALATTLVNKANDQDAVVVADLADRVFSDDALGGTSAPNFFLKFKAPGQ